MLNVLMPQIILNGSGIMPLRREVIAARMPELVGIGHKRPSSITPSRGEEHTMATYEDVLAEILYEVTNRPRVSVQAWIAPLSEVLGYEIKLEDTLTETERDAWLMKLRLEKPRILHWLAERGHP
jgi:hypothetical protein